MARSVLSENDVTASPVGILGLGCYVPERVLENSELAPRLGVTPEWIDAKTGVLERRVAAPDQATSDLGALAARRALDAAGTAAREITLIVVATSTPDHPMPPTACRVQALIGAEHAAALDVDAACTGFVYALQMARAMLATDAPSGKALVVGADTYSRILDYRDRRTAALFGDGAGAVVLGPVQAPYGIRNARLGSDGTKADLVGIPAGGSRFPAQLHTVAAGQHYFTMKGRAVREFAEQTFPLILAQTLAESGLSVDDVDLIVPHQANVRLLESLTRGSGLRRDQIVISADRFGNTGAASVPLALAEAYQAGRLRDGDDVLLVAFGGGMTWGGILLHWGSQNATPAALAEGS